MVLLAEKRLVKFVLPPPGVNYASGGGKYNGHQDQRRYNADCYDLGDMESPS